MPSAVAFSSAAVHSASELMITAAPPISLWFLFFWLKKRGEERERKRKKCKRMRSESDFPLSLDFRVLSFSLTSCFLTLSGRETEAEEDQRRSSTDDGSTEAAASSCLCCCSPFRLSPVLAAPLSPLRCLLDLFRSASKTFPLAAQRAPHLWHQRRRDREAGTCFSYRSRDGNGEIQRELRDSVSNRISLVLLFFSFSLL